jgi:hypothetical protein
VQYFAKLMVIGTHNLGKDVETTGSEHQVVNLLNGGNLFCNLTSVSGHSDSNHGLPVKTELAWVGDCDNLHHTTINEFPHPLPNGRFTQPNFFGNFRVGRPAIPL